ncbi:MAG: ABC transporter permease [Treponema sp.]|jgi:peptide/nickel transport system permease protein|nr:ABC transporter permease [Treponema sp.]
MKTKTRVRSESRSQLGLIIFRFKKNKLAIFGLCVLGVLLLIVLSAPLYADYENAIRQDIPHAFQKPGVDGHILGTDAYGRDLFTRMVFGGRISLLAGLSVVILALTAGVTVGGIAGYFGGSIDTIIMRVVDIFMAVPALLLSLAICTALGEGARNMVIALMVADIPRIARITRSSILTLRDQEFIEAAKCCGTSTFRIIVKHILPNGIGPVIVTATLTLGSAILNIASLGFLGVGINAPTPEWGTILSDNKAHIRYYPYLGLIPGIAIAISVMCVNFVGDGLRDALDPKMKK